MSWGRRRHLVKSPATEPARDSRLARAIRDAEGRGPSRARLEMLGTRIAVAAWVALESRRDCAWWEWMTRWARAEVALATAAAVLALVAGNLTNAWSSDGRSVIVPATAVEAGMSVESLGIGRVDSVVTRSLAVGASSDQVMNALVGPATGDWLFTADVLR